MIIPPVGRVFIFIFILFKNAPLRDANFPTAEFVRGWAPSHWENSVSERALDPQLAVGEPSIGGIVASSFFFSCWGSLVDPLL